MIGYRASIGGGGGGSSYTALIDGEPAEYSSFPSCFANNATFNSIDFEVGENIAIFDYAFYGCSNFNQPFIIPNTALSCIYMYTNCSKFNQSVVIPNNVRNCYSMFSKCTNLNKSVTIGSNVENLSSTFSECSNFNQTLIIPASVNTCYWMLNSTSNFGSNIYIKGKEWRDLNIKALNAVRSKRINICFNSVLNNIFNNINQNKWFIDKYSGTITWTTTTNGFYNTTYNLYCYYNYAG